MSRISKASDHLSVEELKEKIKTTKGFWKVQQWLIIYNAYVAPRKSSEIAKHLGVSKATVNKTISEYNRFGPIVIENKKKGSRGRSYLTLEEEEEFLKPYIEKAVKGKIATVKEIHIAFRRHVGEEVAASTVYRLLRRHKWREVVPRPSHPKGNKEAQDWFKKTSRVK